ncbi:Serine/threonine-protein kinase [Trichinella spiralis]|uniref:Serine/threonine-protein kinase n=1 Tax=Trichinella spiralis TaxID=6334 RepID=A0ABR3KXY4_TRISP
MTAIRPSGPIKQLVIGQRQGFECENVRSYVPIDPETQLLSMVRCWCRPSNGVQSTSTGYRKEPANQKQTTVEPDDDNDAQTSDPAVNVLLSWLTLVNCAYHRQFEECVKHQSKLCLFDVKLRPTSGGALLFPRFSLGAHCWKLNTNRTLPDEGGHLTSRSLDLRIFVGSFEKVVRGRGYLLHLQMMHQSIKLFFIFGLVDGAGC